MLFAFPNFQVRFSRFCRPSIHADGRAIAVDPCAVHHRLYLWTGVGGRIEGWDEAEDALIAVRCLLIYALQATALYLVWQYERIDTWLD